ncbi:pentraxin-related protein PTX3 [Hoplias malabaricus]|uniref:pentraxin-related protein PTX3 n=1 Tax=Hoplias malabaricus TaxID=27720 RepID=UPI003461854F
MALTLFLCLLLLPPALDALEHEYGDYPESYYNQISDGEQQEGEPSVPCGSRDQSRWDKLFTSLEDSHMRQNMILESGETMVRNFREEIRSTTCHCSDPQESCRSLVQQLELKLGTAVDQMKKTADWLQVQCSSALQQLENFTELLSLTIQLEKLQDVRIENLQNFTGLQNAHLENLQNLSGLQYVVLENLQNLTALQNTWLENLQNVAKLQETRLEKLESRHLGQVRVMKSGQDVVEDSYLGEVRLMKSGVDGAKVEDGYPGRLRVMKSGQDTVEDSYLGQVRVMKSGQNAVEDVGTLARVLMSTAADLRKVQKQLTLLQRAAAHRYLPSGCEMALLFPMRSKHSFAETSLSRSLSLDAVSVCLWARATEALDRTVLFSYSSTDNPRELQLLLNGNTLVFRVGGEPAVLRAPGAGTEGQWRHFCGIWSSEGGVASLWVGGHRVCASSGILQDHLLPTRGTILLGHERSSSGKYRDMDAAVAFTGKLTAVNMWSRPLQQHEIQKLANQDASCDQRGDLIGWGVTEIIPHGGAQYIN